MRCLMCGKELTDGSFADVFIGEDPLCSECRGQWKRIRCRFRLEGIQVYSSYLYDEAFSACLIQYKECGDEALKDVFLYEEKEILKRKYRGYTLVPMPSSERKRELRGFSHMERMLECTGLPVLEAFEKTADIDQKNLSGPMRRQIAGSIRLKEGIVLPEKTVLCDDTVTTGSTLKAALDCIGGSRKKLRIYTVSANRRWLKGKHLFHCYLAG